MKNRSSMKPSERKSRAMALHVINSTSCGECQACCHAVAVEQIGKDEYTTCQHQCPAGCAIYNLRPEACRVYYCFWRMSKAGWMPGGIGYRPDNLRAIFDADQVSSGLSKSGQKPYIRCWQLDSPTQILDDPVIRKATYDLAVKLMMPVLGYYEQEQRSVHLIKRLSMWRPAFEKHEQGYPVYDLTPNLLTFEERHQL